MYCEKCGTRIDAGEYCPNCGCRQRIQPYPSTPAPPTEVVYTPDFGKLGWKKVNKITMAVLSMLFGSFGVHKFYSGKILQGVVYILLCWTMIPAVLGFIEGIIALTKESGPDNMVYVNPNKFFI